MEDDGLTGALSRQLGVAGLGAPAGQGKPRGIRSVVDLPKVPRYSPGIGLLALLDDRSRDSAPLWSTLLFPSTLFALLGDASNLSDTPLPRRAAVVPPTPANDFLGLLLTLTLRPLQVRDGDGG